MKILIIGGTSNLAIALKKGLASFGEVITAGRKDCDIEVDISRPESLVLPEGLDVVINTAAHFGGKEDQEIFKAEAVNVLGSLSICQAAHSAGVKQVVLISSVFAALTSEAPNYSIYALSKRHAEELAAFYCSARNLPLAILRPSQLYGNGEGFRKHQPFFYTIADKAEKGEDIVLYGSNDPHRNYLHVEDLVSIVREVIKQKIEGVFTCSYPTDVTYSQVIQAAYAAFGTNGKLSFLKDKPDIPDFTIDKDEALYRKIGFFPAINIEAGMKRLAAARISNK